MNTLKNICLVEDDIEISKAIVEFFSFEGYSVFDFNSYESFNREDLADFRGIYLIDWNLPGKPGTEIIHEIRKKDKVSPVFIVSGYSNRADILEGLRIGADDYITKPFNFDELLIRVENALIKYNIIKDQISDEIIKLLPEARSFIKDGKTINLTAREYIIFEYLYTNQEAPSTREVLTHQFSASDKITDRNIDVHIFSLRKKIAEAGIKIETVWKKGYKLIS